MLAIDLGQVLRELYGVAVTVADQPLGRSQLTESADAEIWQSAVARRLQHALDAELRRNVAGVVAKRLHTRSMFAVEADAGFVDQRRAEGMRVAERGAHGVHLLVPVPEAAAVRIAAEGAGDELRIMRPAKTHKHLVLLREVLIAADVQCVHII